MKYRTLLLLSLALAALGAAAQSQEARMNEIRQAYADRLEIIKNKPFDDDTPFNQISVDVAQNRPGSGLCNRHDTYYFTQEDFTGDGKSDLHCTVHYATSKVDYAMGAHHYYWEFLWHPMEGDPMFALLVRQEEGSKVKTEYRFYLQNGKVFKCVPAVKDWPKDDTPRALAPHISGPAEVVKLMKTHQERFQSLVFK